MHVGDMTVGMVPAIAIVGGNMPIAAGRGAGGQDAAGSGRVAVCFFGDGAANEGAFHEGLNMAAIWDLPVVFVVREQPLRRLDAVRRGVQDRRTSPIAPAPTASPA